jgi:BMFP domain-containing protein YqiC
MPDQTADPDSAALDAVDKLIDNLDQTIQRYDDLTQQKLKLEADLAESQQLEKTALADESLSHDIATQQLIAARGKSDVLRVRVESLHSAPRRNGPP